MSGIIFDSEPVQTCDIRLAASLLSIGVKPETSALGLKLALPNQSASQRFITFKAKSDDGKYRTRELIDAWREGLGWIEKNPDHPWAYCMACMMNHRDMLIGIKQEETFSFLQKGNSVAMLRNDCDSVTEEKILGRW